MANTMRWRYGETNPVLLPVDATTVIEIGDLVYMETDDARPASLQTDQGTETANQQEFHTKFVGIAMQNSPANDYRSIRIATSGVFEYDCAASSFEIGDLIGPAENSSGDGLEDQTVVAVASAGQSIGRCGKRVTGSKTRVLIDIVGTVLRGGVQVAA